MQHLLSIIIEKWKRALDKNMKVGAIFMDLSKVFDTLNHRLLLAKLKARTYVMFNVSSKSIKPSIKVMRICDHFHWRVFLNQTFFNMFYFKVVSGVQI